MYVVGTSGFETPWGGAVAVDEAPCSQRGGDVLGGHGVAVHDVDGLQCFDRRFLLGVMVSSALLNTLLEPEPVRRRAHPGSSGKTRRHRLNRGGNRPRQPRPAHHRARPHVLGPRICALCIDAPHDGLSKKEIIRCLKCYVVRKLYTALLAGDTALHP